LGSQGYYIQQEQERAARDGAPLNAIYKQGEAWVTTFDCINFDLARRIEDKAKIVVPPKLKILRDEYTYREKLLAKEHADSIRALGQFFENYLKEALSE
jgi:hypothetical protein